MSVLQKRQSRTLLSLAALSLMVCSVGCPKPDLRTPDAGPPDLGNSGFQGQVGLVTGAYAMDADAVRHWRAKVANANAQAERTVNVQRASLVNPVGDPILEDIARLDMAGHLRATLPHQLKPLEWSKSPTWRRGEMVVSFVHEAYTRPELHKALWNVVRESGLDDGLKMRVTSCTDSFFCLVNFFDENDKPLDLLETERTIDALDVALETMQSDASQSSSQRVGGLKTLARNFYRHIMATPNDEYYPVQWHFAAAKIPTAWDITVGDDSVVMAVLDSGLVLEHPDVQGRWVQGADLISDPGVGGDGNGRDTDPTDPGDQAYGDGSSWHGTHVAGTLGAATNNGIGVSGVTWQGKILPVRTLGMGGQGVDFDILSGLAWAVGGQADDVPRNQNPAKVVNLSLGGPTDAQADQLWLDVVTEVLETRAEEFGYPIFVVAAGNEDQDVQNSSPGNLSKVITIGATRYNGERASYSNWGVQVDVMAPGGETNEDLNQDTFGDGVLSLFDSDYNFNQGTSMATPHVTGIIGLMLAIDPSLQHDEVQLLLKNTAVIEGQCNEGCGAGNVDATAALLAIGGEVAQVPRISLDQNIVVFAAGQTKRDVNIVNVGAVAADFTITVSGAQGDLFTTSRTEGTVEAGAYFPIEIQLTRGEFEAGSANILVEGIGEAQGQSFRVDVSFSDAEDPLPIRVINQVQVTAYSVNEIGELRLSGEPVITSAGAQFAWDIFPLHDGNHYVFGVGDDNGDGIFDAQRESIGAWPRIDAPKILELETNQILASVNFNLSGGFFVPTNQGAAGDPCTDDSECTFAPDASCISDDTWPNGYCTRDCQDGYCGAGANCESLSCGQGTCFLCLKTCAANSQCRLEENFQCDDYGTCTPQGF
ncbi:MAG: S8 family serine peptidase [Deltaproteobacteria bacterium]|nr:S8 family serine peptidase [Deltaproteobacteria bacterium]